MHSALCTMHCELCTDMIVFKYTKTDLAQFIPHLDTLRHIERIIRRAGMEINCSQGFNPHSLIYLSAPMPVGVETLSEYCTVDLKNEEPDFLNKFNDFAPRGIKCAKVFNVSKNPDIFNLIKINKYEITGEKLPAVDIIITGNEFLITDKGGAQKNVFDRVKKLEEKDGKLYAYLFIGEKNLRVDYFLNNLEKRFNTDAYAVKTASYTEKMENVDDILSGELIVES